MEKNKTKRAQTRRRTKEGVAYLARNVVSSAGNLAMMDNGDSGRLDRSRIRRY